MSAIQDSVLAAGMGLQILDSDGEPLRGRKVFSRNFYGSDHFPVYQSHRLKVTRPRPVRFENLLARPDPTRDFQIKIGTTRLDPQGFEHLVIQPVGRAMTREKPCYFLIISSINVSIFADTKSDFFRVIESGLLKESMFPNLQGGLYGGGLTVVPSR